MDYPEAGLSITDAATYGQVAAYLSNGSVYGPPEQGVGHIYGPTTVATTLLLHRLLGLHPSPRSVRILGLIFFLAAGVLLALALRQEWSLPWPLLALIILASACAQIWYGTFGSVYTADLRLFLLSLLMCLSLSPYAGAPALAVLCVAVLGAMAPNFAACGLVLLPLWRDRPRDRAGMLLAGALGLALWAWAYIPASRFYWCVSVPLFEPKNALLNVVLGSLDPRTPWPYGAIAWAGLGLLAWTPGRLPRSLWLALGLFIACLPPALKVGGGWGNFAPFAWIAWAAGLAAAFQAGRVAMTTAAFLSVLVALQASGGFIRGQILPRQPTPLDFQHQAMLDGALDYGRKLKWKVWADSAPSYFASRGLPARFDITHMWEQRMSGDGRSLNALLSALHAKEFDLVAVHVDPGDPSSPIVRCLGPEVLALLDREYSAAAWLPRDPRSDAGIGDIRFNGGIRLYCSQPEKARLFQRGLAKNSL